MKLNWAERWVVNNPSRIVEQRLQMRWFKKKAALAAGGTILEIGCGRGAGARLILEHFQPAVLHAMDLDIEMIRKAGKYLPVSQRKLISMYAADVTHLPCRDESFDAVFGFGVLHHVPDWRGALTEISRVLKTGGVYCLEEIYPFVYQNFITKHILLHPREDRFFSRDIKEGLDGANLTIRDVLEAKYLGLLGVFVKTHSQGTSSASKNIP